jgi:cytochrome P450
VFSNDNDARMRGFARVQDHCRLLYQERDTRAATSTVLQALNEAMIDGAPPTEDDYLGVLELLVHGGNETTVNALGSTLHRLATNEHDRDRVAADPTLVPQLVEEALRHQAPVVALGRTLVKDCELGGHEMKAGQMVLLSWMGANRDEEMFPNADEFNLDRTPNNHLAFGAGPHRCLGSHLARAIVCTGTERLLARLPDLRIPAGTALEHRMGASRGLHELPLEFTPR